MKTWRADLRNKLAEYGIERTPKEFNDLIALLENSSDSAICDEDMCRLWAHIVTWTQAKGVSIEMHGYKEACALAAVLNDLTEMRICVIRKGRGYEVRGEHD